VSHDLRAAPALRRSPLAERHRQAGARFVASGEWPATYGDGQRERSAIRERVALLDWGPLDKILLFGAPPAASPPAPALVPGTITTAEMDGRAAQLWGLNDDESMLVVAAANGALSRDLAAQLELRGAVATDVSSLYAAFRLAGPHARAVLEGLFPEDVSERALADRSITFGPLANVNVTLARMDHEGIVAFVILVERDQAEYLWDSLLHSGAMFGIEPVGAAAMAKD
jgi:aminomethyltransferase